MRAFLTIILCLTASSLFAETAAQKAERCEATSAIVADAVKLRSGGAKAAQAKASLTSGDLAVESRLAPAVGPLVDWVYTLENDQLSDEVSKSFLKSCLEY